MYQETKTISIGSQKLFDLGPVCRYTIAKVLPVREGMFQFSVRAKVFNETQGKPLEVRFSEFPTKKILIDPETRRKFGKPKKEVKLIKSQPMLSYYFTVGLDGNLK